MQRHFVFSLREVGPQSDGGGLALDIHHHKHFTLICKLDRIPDQVHQDLPQPVRVTHQRVRHQV